MAFLGQFMAGFGLEGSAEFKQLFLKMVDCKPLIIQIAVFGNGILWIIKCACQTTRYIKTSCDSNMPDGNQIMWQVRQGCVVADPDPVPQQGQLLPSARPGLGFERDGDLVSHSAARFEVEEGLRPRQSRLAANQQAGSGNRPDAASAGSPLYQHLSPQNWLRQDRVRHEPSCLPLRPR